MQRKGSAIYSTCCRRVTIAFFSRSSGGDRDRASTRTSKEIVASVIQFWQLLDFSSFGNFCMNIYCHCIVGNSKVNIQLLYLAGYMFRILQSRENSSNNYIHSKAVTNTVFISS